MRLRAATLLLVKLGLSIALIWYAFTRVDLSDALSKVTRISFGAAIAVGLTLFAQAVLATWRLQTIVGHLGCRLRFAAALDAVFIGGFFSQTFISFIGGDAMRIWRMTARGVPLGTAARVVLIDRVVGFAALIGLTVLSVFLLFGIVRDPVLRASVMAATGLGIVALVGFLVLSKLPGFVRSFRLGQLIADASAQTLELVQAPRDLARVALFSLAMHLTNVVAIYLIASELQVGGTPIDYLTLVPPVLLLAMLPVSFAGWGVREGAMVVALALIGVPPEQSVAVSVCFGLALLAVSLPGGALWFLARKEPLPASTR